MSGVGEGGGRLNFGGGGGGVQKRASPSPDFRSPEVGISAIMSKSRGGGVLPYKSDGGARRTF